MLEVIDPSIEPSFWHTIHMEGLSSGVTTYSDGQGNVYVTFRTYPSGIKHRLSFPQREATVANINARLKKFHILPHR